MEKVDDSGCFGSKLWIKIKKELEVAEYFVNELSFWLNRLKIY